MANGISFKIVASDHQRRAFFMFLHKKMPKIL
jgi:hypothetical protein